MADTSLPKSRREAKAKGLPRYFTGKPCKHGHIAERFTAGACCECTAVFLIQNREALRAYNREYQRAYYKKTQWRRAYRRPRHSAKRNERQLLAAGRPRPDRCEVCTERRTLRFDHCHASGRFRGWICDRCNITLGQVKDSSTLLRELAAYLERHQQEFPQADWVQQAETKTLLNARP